jgi:Tfp pilus assembly protein PilF
MNCWNKKNVSISTMQPTNAFARLGGLVLAVLITVLAGCVTTGPVKPSPPPAVRAPDAAAKVSVKRLTDGREGFIIMEHVKMDAAARDDFQRAVAMLNEGDNVRAIELLEKVIQQSPGVTAPYIDLALAYERIGELEKAEANLKTALGLVPDHPLACNAYGLLCRKAGRFDEARTTYEKVLARFPDYYPVHRNLGILCDLYLNDSACAMEHFEIYSKANPEDKKVKIWIADLQNRMNQ